MDKKKILKKYIINSNNPEEIKKIIENKKKIILDFWAKWCNPCLKLGRTLKEILINIINNKSDEENDIPTIIKIDVEQLEEDVVNNFLKYPMFKFVEDISSIPVTAYFNDGKLLDRKILENQAHKGILIGSRVKNRMVEILKEINFI